MYIPLYIIYIYSLYYLLDIAFNRERSTCPLCFSFRVEVVAASQQSSNLQRRENNPSIRGVYGTALGLLSAEVGWQERPDSGTRVRFAL